MSNLLAIEIDRNWFDFNIKFDGKYHTLIGKDKNNPWNNPYGAEGEICFDEVVLVSCIVEDKKHFYTVQYRLSDVLSIDDVLPDEIDYLILKKKLFVDKNLTFDQCLREEFLINSQNYPTEYHNLFTQKYKRAESRFKDQFTCTVHDQKEYCCFKKDGYEFHNKRMKMSIQDIKEKYGDIASIKEAVNTHNERILIDTMSKIFIDEYNEEQNSVDHALLEGQDLARVDINYVAQRAAKKIIDSLDIKNI